MAEYRIKHITRYTYPSPVIDSANQVMLFPLEDEQQQVKKHELLISHQPAVELFIDYFGNRVGIFSVIKPHHELLIESVIEVLIGEARLPVNDRSTETQWENLQLVREQFPYMDFMLQEQCGSFEEISGIANGMLLDNAGPSTVASRMSAFVFEHFEYKKGITSVETQVDEIWKLKAGVCKDFAHIILVMLLMVGYPAR